MESFGINSSFAGKKMVLGASNSRLSKVSLNHMYGLLCTAVPSFALLKYENNYWHPNVVLRAIAVARAALDTPQLTEYLEIIEVLAHRLCLCTFV